MPIVKAQCTNCGGNLEVDDTKDAAICPFCNTPYVVEQAINKFNVSNSSINVQNAVFNMNNKLDADTMFENWVVADDPKLRKDFKYYYATDPRNEYMEAWLEESPVKGVRILRDPNIDLDILENLARTIFVGDRFSKYLDKELQYINRAKRNKNEKAGIVIMLIVGIIIAVIAFIIDNM